MREDIVKISSQNVKILCKCLFTGRSLVICWYIIPLDAKVFIDLEIEDIVDANRKASRNWGEKGGEMHN